ncbi:MAG TPA: molybdenum cofactor guanylyltransferase [Micromonosporaceae bacterium]
MAAFAAVVLAGGTARRLGGLAKPALPIGGRPMLLRVLDAVPGASPRVVVGPSSLAGLLPGGVLLTREEPPDGGPVAGLAAGVRLVPDEVAQVAVLSSDLPFLSPTVLGGLCAAVTGGADVAVLVDDKGRRQWLCAVWRRASLAGRLAALGEPGGLPMWQLVGGVAVRDVAGRSDPPSWFDCDTDDDLRRAEEWADADPG